MNIEWRPIIIDGIMTDYIVSEYSNIINIKTGKTIKPSRLQGSERERVGIYINGVRKDFKIYRLSYQAFYGPIPIDKTIDHIDENIHNNHISNLRLLTVSENIKSFLNNHPDHGFQKKYSDNDIRKFFETMKDGMYYKDAAKLINISDMYAYDLLRGLRRKDLWAIYEPFPQSAHRKSYISPSDQQVAISCIIDGFTTKEILDYLDIQYDEKGIDAISKLRQKVGIKDPKFFEQSFLHDIDTLIINGKTNSEIYNIMNIEISQRISDMMARRRKRLNIPNNNCKVGDPDEIKMIKKYIGEGLSNSEILIKIGKEKSMYYVNLFGRIRQENKKKNVSD